MTDNQKPLTDSIVAKVATPNIGKGHTAGKVGTAHGNNIPNGSFQFGARGSASSNQSTGTDSGGKDQGK